MVEDGFAETDQGPTCRSAQVARLKKLAMAAGNETASGAKQAPQLAAVCMIRPDSAGNPGAEDEGADLVLAGTGLIEVKSPEHMCPTHRLLRRKRCQTAGSDRKSGTRGKIEEALGCSDPQPPERIGLDHDGKPRPVRRRVRAGCQETVFGVAGRAQNQMEALIGGECRAVARPTQRIETQMRVGVGWGGNEAHEVDKQLGSPEQDGFIAAAVWMLQDFATPSGGQRRPAGAWCSVP